MANFVAWFWTLTVWHFNKKTHEIELINLTNQLFLLQIGAHENNEVAASGGVDAQFSPERMEEALKALIENIRHRSGLLKICKAGPGGAGDMEPDIR